MIELLLIVGIYSAFILFFVPLERIGKVQTSFKNWVQKMIDKAKS